MKRNYAVSSLALMMVCLLALSSCKNKGKEITVTAGRMEMNADWDANPNVEAQAVFAAYKSKVDSIMEPVIGTSEVGMTVQRPESALANLVADVLRQSAVPYIGKPADVGLMNIGGVRNNLNKGDITYRDIFEILPFQNSLCIVSIKGSVLKNLATNIILVGGEAVSNMQITATKSGELLDVTVDNKPIDDNKVYTVATIDYIAEGNDRMEALLQNESAVCDEEATVRELFVKYVLDQTKKGKSIHSKIEGRIKIMEDK